jgi:hypothetical protein
MNKRFPLPLFLLLILLPATVFSMSGREQQRDAPDGCPAGDCPPAAENRSLPAAAYQPGDVQLNGNTTVIDAADSGWYTDAGDHIATNTNYIVGFRGLDFVGDFSDQMVPPVDTDATGEARFLRNEDDSEIRYELTTFGIGDATAAHIHCASSGQNGPVGVTLPIGSSGGSGIISAPDAGNSCGWPTLAEVVVALEAGNAYVLVHTTTHPSGEIRGRGALGTISDDASELWVAYEVRTPINQLLAENVGRTDIYGDLDSPELVFGFSHLGNHVRQLVLVSSIDCNDVSEIPQAECAALIALFNSAGGLDWLNRSDWLATETPCGWHGVHCDGGHVDSLDLSGNGLAGTLPKEFGDLAGLSSVKINDNARLLGPLPLSMGDLSLSSFWFQNTSLCVPAALDGWLTGIADSNGTDVTCQFSNLPLMLKK